MTEDQYWYGETFLRHIYLEKHRISMRQQNELAWINGQYILQAIAVVLQDSKKGNRITYPEKPFEYYTRQKSKEEIEREKHMKAVEMRQRFYNMLKSQTKKEKW